jgi:hypothetical protein
MLYFDSHFSMGRTHLVCEDYARRGHSPFPWVMISDGCSSSNDTDIGSRLLILAAQKYLSQLNRLPDYDSFGKQVISHTLKIAHSLGVPDNALDATLLLAIAKGRTIQIYVYGDGFIVLKNKQNDWRIIEFSFTQNAPFYLSYWIDESYRASYQKMLQTPKTLQIYDGKNSGLFSFDKALQYQFSLDEYPLIAITSDGLSKFIDMNHYKPVSIQTLLPQLFDFPSLSGSFVKRRLPAVLSSLETRKILPFDDFSTGVFVDAIS